MSKTSITLILLILFFIVLPVMYVIGQYNSIISAQESVMRSLSDIDTQLRRRTDLIPNLINSVKGYVDHEKGVIASVTQAREKMLGASTVGEKAAAEANLTRALGSFMVLVENYPDLKANTNFIQLQDELAGTENRIATARRDYNGAVEYYNFIIKRFPGYLFAKRFGFVAAEYFKTDEDSKAVPNVTF